MADMRPIAAPTIPQAAEVPGFVLVPREPTEEMWGELARDIVWFLYSTSAPHRGVKFYKWLENMGRTVPDWLRAEIPDIDHSPSKGTWAVCIYKAMLAAAPTPTASAREPLTADEVIEEWSRPCYPPDIHIASSFEAGVRFAERAHNILPPTQETDHG
jgi:hypothetical protein